MKRFASTRSPSHSFKEPPKPTTQFQCRMDRLCLSPRYDFPFMVPDCNDRKGTTIHFNMAAMHRNPKYWTTPESFLPERFIEGTPEWNEDLALRGGKSHTFHYMPFSMGSKGCIGQKFVMAELQLVVATLVSKYILHQRPRWTFAKNLAESQRGLFTSR
ncbi:hypothetical protein AC1031_022150 [Aphanomyces cochlioides]|nr:hypothetical protein AC1031_022150 [Aphanomyces cochlioides]